MRKPVFTTVALSVIVAAAMIVSAQAQDGKGKSLYRVGDLYFVRDGHHRVSVAKSLGRQDIDAYVNRLFIAAAEPAAIASPALAEVGQPAKEEGVTVEP